MDVNGLKPTGDYHGCDGFNDPNEINGNDLYPTVGYVPSPLSNNFSCFGFFLFFKAPHLLLNSASNRD